MSTIELRKMLLSSAAAIGAVTLAPGIAAAQTAPPAPAQTTAEDDGGPKLEDIVVTADRTGTEAVQVGSFRGAKIIDTPLTISVIPEQLLKSQQALNLFDALRNTPGVTSSQTNPSVYNNLSIRGIPVENRGNYRLNGSLPIVNNIDQPLEDKVRVEALKGASALYYGFTSPSGIVNLITKRPTKEPLLVVDVTGNDHGQVQGHIDASATAGILGVRANFVYGGVDNGIDRTRGYRSFQSGAFQLDPLEGLQINVDVEHIYKEVTEPTVWQGPITGTLMSVVPKIPALSTNAGSRGFLNRADETNLLGRIAYKITPAWTISAEGGLSYETRNRRFSTLQNFDPVTGYGNLNATAADGQLYRNRNLRGEIAGTFATGPIVHELLIGASKNLRRQYSPVAVAVVGTGAGAPRAACAALGLPVPVPTVAVPVPPASAYCRQNGYDPIALADIQFGGPSTYDPRRDTMISDAGLYAFDRAKFGGPNGDLISILIGVRKSYYKETAQALPSGTSLVVAPVKTFSDNPVSLSGGLVIKPVPWASAYGTYIEGLETTVGPPQTALNFGQNFPATKSKQYEGGFKIEPKKGLLFTGAYFNIDRGLAYVNTANLYVQDGRSVYKGVELSLSGDVTRDFSLYASALFLDAKQGKTADPTLIGKQVENTAKTQWSISGEYRLTPVLPGLAITAAAFHTGSRAINPSNSLFLPGYTLFDLGGSYTFSLAGREMTARVYAQNITDKRYFASTSSNFISYGVPASVKFSLSMKIF
ncbi:MAG: ligand-gated channel [Sphingomonas bacterium]|uniref:TonB-dependent siderophore receptor n=1 Tax=Sphingomonas bacterium TaxID=1895847 RepID=UPI002633FD22|nr:TonB-dependent receptor [Sphingomonas bacterium]MDB5707334.1 ligand-gated channel [Sphingomonas bacterium]